MEQDIIKNTEIVEDMPDFEEITAKMPCEGEESVTENGTADAENAIVSEEKPQGDTQEEKKDEKPNLPQGFSFNPLVMAIKPFYEKAMAEDELFAKEVREKESRKEKPKSLAECADYIMGEAYNYASSHRNGSFGLAGCPDEDMLGLIKHYYDEDDIVIRKMGAGVKAQVSVSKPKAKKPERPKETMKPGLTKMIRPETKREAKRESKKQADNVIQMDIFSMLGDTEE